MGSSGRLAVAICGDSCAVEAEKNPGLFPGPDSVTLMITAFLHRPFVFVDFYLTNQ